MIDRGLMFGLVHESTHIQNVRSKHSLVNWDETEYLRLLGIN